MKLAIIWALACLGILCNGCATSSGNEAAQLQTVTEYSDASGVHTIVICPSSLSAKNQDEHIKAPPSCKTLVLSGCTAISNSK